MVIVLMSNDNSGDVLENGKLVGKFDGVDKDGFVGFFETEARVF